MSLVEKNDSTIDDRSSVSEYFDPSSFWEENGYTVSIEPHVHRYSTVTLDTVNGTSATTVAQSNQDNFLEGLIVPLYGIIFFLSVVGNCLVLITLARNKQMRTVTNVYLLNLAVSDLLLGVFCMPFTLLGQMLKNFVFGITMCKLISYFQAVSVSVGVWTLVAISLERYFAICRPLKSRRWQTEFHAYKMIAVVWAASLTWNAPILLVSELKNIRGGRRKCREEWSSVGTERAYNLFLDGTLLLVPLIVMSLAYSLIAIKLWRGLKREIRQTSNCQQRFDKLGTASSSSALRGSTTYGNGEHAPNTTMMLNACNSSSRLRRGYSSTAECFHRLPQSKSTAPTAQTQPLAQISTRVRVPQRMRIGGTTFLGSTKCRASVETTTARISRISQNRSNGSCFPAVTRESNDSTNANPQDSNVPCPLGRQHVIRSNYIGKSIESKKKVIRMLFVIVLEFFVCWAPLHVINTWYLFAPELVYSIVGSTGISLVQLLAYISSCCNPITYCFMNRKFRQAFLGVFHCHRCWRVGCRNSDVPMSAVGNATQTGNNSEFSGNESAIYLGKTSLLARTEVVRLLEEEDRV
ncbi:hypothetical protein KPH14_008627 [Odynerus spinipes]|uniref:G-protein coupled receptors family 1 profile domain-containing protein n=1 Tax=Odynerus spinipes TaxID=1348599 RepID=A0AAD9RSN7_9HYME|nr:hypothetical protein KPH14_008627 [Odynerus spinipes]